MNPEDDPEARIRQLEQPLAGYATELGSTESAPTSALPPPVYTGPYDQSPYTAPPFGVAYPRIEKSGPPIGLIMGLIAVVFVLILGGIGAVVWMMSSNTGGRPGIVSGSSGDNDEWTFAPTWTMPSVPSEVAPSDEPPQVAVAPAGGSYSVSGVDNVETIECNGSNISVSGVNNTVTLRGHCLSVNVSGVENKVDVRSADRISASGFDNEVRYHEGQPEITVTSRNVVALG
ncbi:Protein of unknown function [Mycolicibacterium rutilum]|uniref:DUF3060 domain-containing protein n=1 Tax=Mycolicibacterium rutilum TaxID=370526 RepID=A0A1H6IC28_MYCRU|nr:DUF3060 domain-containing protein [Mycolicibacterium rutilum]SEH46837.1 Protein of unknown function [Mycolicibacterium rutilum]